MTTLREPLDLQNGVPPGLAEQAAAWADRWGVPGLPGTVTLQFSGRMSRRLGAAWPTLRRVRLASWLTGWPALLAEVYCHELAHLAARDLHGPAIRPHGREWQALVRAAGFEPKVRLVLPDGVGPPRRRPAARRRWLHRCLVCALQRVARRRMTRWRCAACLEAGRHGRLQIRPYDPTTQE